MQIRITKALVDTTGFSGSDVHLKDTSCVFSEDDDDQFYVYNISPLTACQTELKLNTTHVEYKNKLVAGNEADVMQKGAVIVGTPDNKDRQALSAKLRCVFPVELMVSTAFLPNISHVTIPPWGFENQQNLTANKSTVRKYIISFTITALFRNTKTMVDIGCIGTQFMILCIYAKIFS